MILDQRSVSAGFVPDTLYETPSKWHSEDRRAGHRARPAISGIGTEADPTLMRIQSFFFSIRLDARGQRSASGGTPDSSLLLEDNACARFGQ